MYNTIELLLYSSSNEVCDRIEYSYELCLDSYQMYVLALVFCK